MPKGTTFWNLLAKRYARSPVANQAAYEKKLAVTRQYLQPDMEVLEFGCGTGSTAIAHAPFVKHIQAIDFSSKMLAIARGKAEGARVKNISFDLAGIDQFSAPDGTYDVVMGHSILHLLPNKEAVMAKIFRMLKPGGAFVSSTTCIGNRAKILATIIPIASYFGILPPLQFFTVAELVKSIVDAGFKIDHQWQPGERDAVFIVAKKPG